jgi:hypothetical protein
MAIVMVGIWVLSSFAYMAIARKTKYSSPGIAWIPLVGKPLIASKAAKMHWWPILLLIGAFIPWIGGLFSIAFLVFFIIWHWKMYESINKPAWWAIMWIIYPVGLILLCVAAWSKK